MGHSAAQFVRFSSNSDQVDASRSELSLCAKTGLMHRNKNGISIRSPRRRARAAWAEWWACVHTPMAAR